MEIVVGVDLGIRKIAYAVCVDGKLEYTDALEAHPGHRMDELSAVSDFLFLEIDHLAREHDDADIIVVFEEPLVGNNTKYSMKISQVYGACLAALAMANAEFGIVVTSVNVGTWKKQVVGNGHATKQDVVNHICVLSQRYSELCGHDQDRYDAACVALYGVLLSARAEALTSS